MSGFVVETGLSVGEATARVAALMQALGYRPDPAIPTHFKKRRQAHHFRIDAIPDGSVVVMENVPEIYVSRRHDDLKESLTAFLRHGRAIPLLPNLPLPEGPFSDAAALPSPYPRLPQKRRFWERFGRIQPFDLESPDAPYGLHFTVQRDKAEIIQRLRAFCLGLRWAEVQGDDLKLMFARGGEVAVRGARSGPMSVPMVLRVRLMEQEGGIQVTVIVVNWSTPAVRSAVGHFVREEIRALRLYLQEDQSPPGELFEVGEGSFLVVNRWQASRWIDAVCIALIVLTFLTGRILMAILGVALWVGLRAKQYSGLRPVISLRRPVELYPEVFDQGATLAPDSVLPWLAQSRATVRRLEESWHRRFPG